MLEIVSQDVRRDPLDIALVLFPGFSGKLDANRDRDKAVSDKLTFSSTHQARFRAVLFVLDLRESRVGNFSASFGADR